MPQVGCIVPGTQLNGEVLAQEFLDKTKLHSETKEPLEIRRVVFGESHIELHIDATELVDKKKK